MKYTVIVSEEALEDIQAVFHYISDKECLPATARRWVDSLETAVNALNYQPYRYPQYEIQIPGVSSLRKLVVGKYLVLYTVDDSKQLVSVFRVISSRRDIASLLDGVLSESR